MSHHQSDSTEKDQLFTQMDRDLDLLFIRCQDRTVELDRAKQTDEIFSDLQLKQNEFAKKAKSHQQQPNMSKTRPVQNTRAANAQFEQYTQFGEQKDQEIDQNSQALAELNTQVCAGFDRIFSPTK